MFTNLMSVPSERQAAVAGILQQLLAAIQTNGQGVLTWVEAHLPQILALLSAGFTPQAIVSFILNIFPAQTK